MCILGDSNQNYEDMEKLKIREFTTSATGKCLCGSKKEADEMFRSMGVFGDTFLCNVTVPDGRTSAFWICVDDVGITFLPIFDYGLNLSKCRGLQIQPITANTLLYQKKNDSAGICYMAVFAEDDIIIRLIKIFPDQQLVEAFCLLKGLNPKYVFLYKMYTIQGNEYVTSCWGVYYEKPDELDEDGEPTEYVMYIPVDTADEDLFEEKGIANLDIILLKEGERFKTQSQLYRVLKDEKDKLFITKDLFSLPKEKVKERNLLSKKPGVKAPNEVGKPKEAEKPKTCRIIPLRQH